MINTEFIKNGIIIFITFFLIYIFSSSTIKAQEAIPTVGGNASGIEGSVSYSIGQVFFTTNSGTVGSVAQGVQQPFEISVSYGINETEGINLIISTFPNPAN
ncbi:MAG: hypothetical protein ABIJ97_07575, partial [Bacteroidota bacterium]